MRASLNYSRRRFLHAGTAGVAASVVAATRPVRAAAEAATQAPPPAATAPRILRKPPLPELARIAKSYDLDLSRDDLTSFRNLMDGVLASGHTARPRPRPAPPRGSQPGLNPESRDARRFASPGMTCGKIVIARSNATKQSRLYPW